MWPFKSKNKPASSGRVITGTGNLDAAPAGKIVSRPYGGAVVYTFVPRKDFYSNEFESQYLKDYEYRVREGNERLHLQVQRWVQKEFVSILKE